MIDILGEPLLMALIGLGGGIVLGLAARLGRFCSLGAIEDLLYGHDARRMRQWAIAIGVAMTTTFAAAAVGLADIEGSIYLSFAWHPAASVFGGLLFGYGMALAGNCGFGALARLGGGDFRAFLIVIVMGISAYVALSGPLAGLRVWAFPPDAADGAPGIAHALGRATGLPVGALGMALGLGVIAWALSNRAFRSERSLVLWGAAAGLAVTSAWVGTTWIAQNGFGTGVKISHTFAAPLGETILYFMTASGSTLSFGVGSVAGVAAGAFIGSLLKGHFRWEACEDPRELRRQISGAALMGVGAAVAMGCTIGQGLSAFSVLALSAPVTVAAIFVGAAFGLRQLISGLLPAE